MISILITFNTKQTFSCETNVALCLGWKSHTHTTYIIRSKCINHVIYSDKQAWNIIRIRNYIAAPGNDPIYDSLWLTDVGGGAYSASKIHWKKGASKIELSQRRRDHHKAAVRMSQSIWKLTWRTKCVYIYIFKSNVVRHACTQQRL